MTFVMIPGAGGAAWYWHRVGTVLSAAGHEVVAVDLPVGASSVADYADAVIQATVGREDIVLVAQSMGGFTAAAVADRLPVIGLAFLNAMIPVPGETPGRWWEAVGQAGAMRANDIASGRDPDAAFELDTYFSHDLDDDLRREAERQGGQDSEDFFLSSCDFSRWPNVPTLVLAGCDDRFFPIAFQRSVARARLGRPVEAVGGGHLAALSHPSEVARRLEGLATRPS